MIAGTARNLPPQAGGKRAKGKFLGGLGGFPQNTLAGEVHPAEIWDLFCQFSAHTFVRPEAKLTSLRFVEDMDKGEPEAARVAAARSARVWVRRRGRAQAGQQWYTVPPWAAVWGGRGGATNGTLIQSPETVVGTPAQLWGGDCNGGGLFPKMRCKTNGGGMESVAIQ